jgi:hypothetical protein
LKRGDGIPKVKITKGKFHVDTTVSNVVIFPMTIQLKKMFLMLWVSPKIFCVDMIHGYIKASMFFSIII